MNELFDPREAARNAWVRAVLGDNGIAIARASVDAGFRSYWRARRGGESWIVMDSPPDREDVRPWLRIHELLERGGVRVPRVLARDLSAGFLLLEDLGGATLVQAIDADNADAHFDAAIAQLVRMQAIPVPPGTAILDEALLQRDADLFDEWFLRRHLDLALHRDEAERLQLAQRRLMDNALSQARVLTHRDFMPRNLMPAPDGNVAGGPAVIDFQDMVLGPIAYDPVSLFKDAFLSWPQQRVEGWLRGYHARALGARLPVPTLPVFLRDADWLGVQRHLKILGVFARLHHRDGKSRYLGDGARFIAYLDDVLPRYPELAPLQALLEDRIKPALETRPFPESGTP